MLWFRIAVLALLLSACSSTDPIAPLPGVDRFELREIASEAYPLWNPVAVELVALDLVSGRFDGDDRYLLEFDYTVRKVGEPVQLTAEQRDTLLQAAQRQGRLAEARANLAAPPGGVLYAERLGDVALGETRAFRDTVVLVRHDGRWMPEAWVAGAEQIERQRGD